MWSMERTVAGEWTRYELSRGGRLVASARWRKVGDAAEIHHEVLCFGPETARELLRRFAEIRKDMRAAGCAHVVTMVLTSSHTRTMRRYWEFQGFEFFAERHGKDEVTCAAMEA